MIDIHSHILPGLDDGATTDEDMLLLARGAVADGIRTVIATPHHANGRYENAREAVLQAVDRCNRLLREHGIPLAVLPGQEIRAHREWPEEWAAGRLLTLAGSRYALLEFPSSFVPPYADELLHEMAVLGVTPIIAHPERNAELNRNSERLLELLGFGALAQVTSHSVTGLFGRSIQKQSLDWIERRMVHFIASDAHHPEARPFALSEAYRRIAHKAGERVVDDLLRNAEALVHGRIIDAAEPLPARRRRLFGI